jgi:hypothetical protein
VPGLACVVVANLTETVLAFKKFYYDESGEKGFFSHIDFATKSPHADSLDNGNINNRAKKVGGHGHDMTISQHAHDRGHSTSQLCLNRPGLCQ